MATAKKLEFQAERKAAAWQGGKPQPAPLPGRCARSYLPCRFRWGSGTDGSTRFSRESRSRITTSMRQAPPRKARVRPAVSRSITAARGVSLTHMAMLPRLFFSRRAIWQSCSARQKQSRCASDRALSWHHGDDRPSARAGLLSSFWRMSRCGRVRSSKNSVRTVPALSRARLRAWRRFSLSSTPCRRASAGGYFW